MVEYRNEKLQDYLSLLINIFFKYSHKEMRSFNFQLWAIVVYQITSPTTLGKAVSSLAKFLRDPTSAISVCINYPSAYKDESGILHTIEKCNEMNLTHAGIVLGRGANLHDCIPDMVGVTRSKESLESLN